MKNVATNRPTNHGRQRSTGLFDLRPKEQGKIDCGKKHFKELGSEMIVASEMNDIINYTMRK